MNVPSQNIVIQDCEFLNGHGGITIGSEMSGGVRNVFARNNRMDATALSNCLRLKTNSGRGGFIENIFLSRTKVESTTGPAILIDFFYGEGAGLGHNPVVKGIEIDRLTVGTCQSPIYAVGYPEDHISDISVASCVKTYRDFALYSSSPGGICSAKLIALVTITSCFTVLGSANFSPR